MNQKKVKQLRKLIKPIQVQWLQSLLTKEESKNITVQNITEHLPKETHIKSINGTSLSFMSDKWVMKQLKKYPSITCYEELKQILNL